MNNETNSLNKNNGTPRILVVDDEQVIRESCRNILVPEGYEVETAEDGMAGLERFKKQGNFAAALIDLKMPGMDGIELIEKLHAEDKNIVLFVVTGYATIETAVKAVKKGAYGYISKPFTPDELLLPVKQGIERRSLLIEAKRLREEIALSMMCEEKPELEYILADKGAMRIIFTNLIDNAIKYTPDRGHVWVHVEHNGFYAKVKIKDDGIGMKPGEKDRAFDEFFRAKNEYTAHVPGTGLGLSLVKRLLEMHHGTIIVETAPGEGAEFTVGIPIAG